MTDNEVLANRWRNNPARITPARLLQDAIDALENWPEGAPGYGLDEQHPEDAYSTAAVVLETITGLRIAQWNANRPAPGATSPTD